MTLFLSRLLGISVSYSSLFGSALPKGEFGQVLEGDPSMPPTFVGGFWSFLNPLRNAMLTTFWWKEHSIIDLVSVPKQGVYLMYGDGNVMPIPIFTRFIAVKHGREACRFAVVDARGNNVSFKAFGRHDRDGVCQAVLGIVQDFAGEELVKLFARELNQIADWKGGLMPSELEREARQCLARSINDHGHNLVSFV
jgi:hypothetical protein